MRFDPSSANEVLLGLAEFFEQHPANSEVLRRWIGANPGAPKLRQDLNVPALADVLPMLFDKAAKPSRWRRSPKPARDPKSNVRAADKLLRVVIDASLEPENQIFMLALVRFLETDEGEALDYLLTGYDEFQPVFSAYNELIARRVGIAEQKIEAAHQPPTPSKDVEIDVRERTDKAEWSEDNWIIPGVVGPNRKNEKR